MKKLLLQVFSFLLVSGTGWIIDFSVYFIFTNYLDYKVVFANMISAIPALSFVFIVSTRKIFLNSNRKFSLKKKYIIYFIYQMLLIFCVSWIGQILFNLISKTIIYNISLISRNLKVICKIIITPITMTFNFIVMKVLSEKF